MLKEELEKLISNKGIILVYGESATGKTLLCLEAIKEIAKTKKVIFLEIGNNFSIERFGQIEPNYKSILDNVLLFKIKNFKDQLDKVKSIASIMEKMNVGLVVIDCFSNYYRTLVNSKSDLANAMSVSQLKILNQISKKIPVILTNEVYMDLKTNSSRAIGAAKYLTNFSNCVYEMIKNAKDERCIRIKKHDTLKGDMHFEIKNEGLIIKQS